MRVLLSGFEVFGSNKENPTEKLINSFLRNEISYPAAMKVEAVILPVTYDESYALLKKRIDEFNPDIVLSFGLASSRESIDLETTAVNIMDRRATDNKGYKPTTLQIVPGEPEAFVSTLPLTGIKAALKKEKLPVDESNSAGSYVCNYLFYHLMKDNQDTFRLCGFIHVPPEEKLPFADLQKALSVILGYLDY